MRRTSAAKNNLSRFRLLQSKAILGQDPTHGGARSANMLLVLVLLVLIVPDQNSTGTAENRVTSSNSLVF